jgi:hypothetical protein
MVKDRKTMVPRSTDKWRVILWRIGSSGHGAPGRTMKDAFELAMMREQGARDFDEVGPKFREMFEELTEVWRFGKTASKTLRDGRFAVEVQRINAGYGY